MPTASEIVQEIMGNSRLGPLTAAVKRVGNRVYDKGTREKDELAALVGVDPEVRDFLTTSNQRRISHDWIKDVLRKRHIQKRKPTPEEKAGEVQQPFLFEDWNEIYEIKRGNTINTAGVVVLAHTDFVRLGDFAIPEIDQHRVQMRENIRTAQVTLRRWDAVAPLIRALIEEHPDWTWRDAEQYLQAQTVADA
jgi:hypothetical protein